MLGFRHDNKIYIYIYIYIFTEADIYIYVDIYFFIVNFYFIFISLLFYSFSLSYFSLPSGPSSFSWLPLILPPEERCLLPLHFPPSLIFFQVLAQVGPLGFGVNSRHELLVVSCWLVHHKTIHALFFLTHRTSNILLELFRLVLASHRLPSSQLALS